MVFLLVVAHHLGGVYLLEDVQKGGGGLRCHNPVKIYGFLMKTALQRERVRCVLKCGERYTRKSLVVCVLRSEGLDSGNFAILVSKKTIKSAVLRNRLRRVLREVVRLFDYRCFDVVVLCRGVHGSDADIRGHLLILLGDIFSSS